MWTVKQLVQLFLTSMMDRFGMIFKHMKVHHFIWIPQFRIVIFSQSWYTVGVICLVILNLPRSIRFRPENIMITGIIPGPKEPKNMNFYLRPLVKELNTLWTEGFFLSIKFQRIKIRVAVLATVWYSCYLKNRRIFWSQFKTNLLEV